MTDDEFTYVVKCHTCYAKFKVQLFESHEKNLFLVDKRDWYCDKCKKAYFNKQTETLSKAHQDIGFPVLTGTDKMVSWGEKIRAELINKVFAEDTTASSSSSRGGDRGRGGPGGRGGSDAEVDGVVVGPHGRHHAGGVAGRPG